MLFVERRWPRRTGVGLAVVVTSGLKAYDAGVAVVIDGTSNRLLIAGSGLIPRRFATKIAGRIMHPGKG